MARYLLQKPWTLRGFLDAPYMLIDPTGTMEYPVRPMNETLWNALVQSDGRTDCEEDTAHRVLLKHGLIAPVTEDNGGLDESQTYQLFRFEQKRTVQISITGRCNLNCLHCFMAADKERERSNDDLTQEQLMRIVDQLPGCGVSHVQLTGGEPLICPHFRAVVERLTQRHLEISRILTNGLAVDDVLFDLLEAQGQKPQIVISFDGVGTHDWLRGRAGAEGAALAAMRLTVARGFPLRCTVQVNRRTVSRLTETCRCLKDMGAGSLYLIRTMETPRWAENMWVDESLPTADYYETCCALAETMIREQWGISLDVFNGFGLYFDPKPRLRQASCHCGDESCLHVCGRAAHDFFIEHTGHVLPCDAFEGIGQAGGIREERTVKDTPLVELLGSSLGARLERITLQDIRNANTECQYCSFFPQCGGGCRAVGFGESQFFGEGYAKGKGQAKQRASTTCTYYRGGYDARMRVLTEPPKEETSIIQEKEKPLCRTTK